jgi:periplasmic protein TonB
MQPEQIMSSDLLDILFADRNKMYGAYTLRRYYNRRLTKAMLITSAIVCAALLLYYSVQQQPKFFETRTIFIDSLELKPVDPVKPLVPPPPPPQPRQQVSVKQFTSPVIVQQTTQPPPPIEELINSQVGTENRNGTPDAGFPPPAISGNSNSLATPITSTENKNVIHDKVDIESSYPGGPKAWKRFLIRTFRYPDQAQENQIAGTVLIKFVVDKDGKVSGIQALSGPEELRAEAIRVISKSGRWIPAMQQGHVVNSYKYQQIVFQLSE